MQSNLAEIYGHLYTDYAIKNVNPNTGIHFGVINGHTPSHDATDVYDPDWDNVSEEDREQEFKETILLWLNSQEEDDIYNAALAVNLEHDEDFMDALEATFDGGPLKGLEFTEDDLVAVLDAYHEATDGAEYGPDTYEYSSGGYLVRYNTDSNIITVLKSPYVVQTRWCAPTYPGAGDLDAPLVSAEEIAALDPNSTRAQVHALFESLAPENDYWFYCLGPEWFDEYSPCPYVPAKLGGSMSNHIKHFTFEFDVEEFLNIEEFETKTTVRDLVLDHVRRCARGQMRARDMSREEANRWTAGHGAMIVSAIVDDSEYREFSDGLRVELMMQR